MPAVKLGPLRVPGPGKVRQAIAVPTPPSLSFRPSRGVRIRHVGAIRPPPSQPPPLSFRAHRSPKGRSSARSRGGRKHEGVASARGS
eukprot:59019-Rhodomonas_salina.1